MQPSSAVPAWNGDAPLVGLPRPLCTLTGRELFPACVVTPERPADIKAICAEFDESPLAIELAAARCRIMAPHELRLRI